MLTGLAGFYHPGSQIYDLYDLIKKDLVAWIIPKDALSSCFSTQGIT